MNSYQFKTKRVSKLNHLKLCMFSSEQHKISLQIYSPIRRERERELYTRQIFQTSVCIYACFGRMRVAYLFKITTHSLLEVSGNIRALTSL
jgi:uncharacterized Zn finger protein